MCLTVPYRVKKIDGHMAQLDDGRIVNASMIDELGVGDHVLANADLAVSKISKKEAEEINNYFKK